MKILVDMNLSPRWPKVLREAGHEAIWWKEVGAINAPDQALFAWAKEHGYIVLTADLDFPHLLALTGENGPSVLLLRLAYPEPPEATPWVLAALTTHKETLEKGAIAVIGPEKTRLRLLPLR
ncbi:MULTISPECIES: DUF5615 family PIN-like protein [Thermus]|uniref:DUF5615 domain-containing protein n=1 Tax=Thermus scotoductus (strain ATCC 700910 / SA-01) TaxID=743525 RepID=E8PP56_THESS|nr:MULTISPECIES: DUF5615 family PIN-like protein [Thermus]ADW22781.1 conserved hypothetical protein [Thermus scotoductus SA-01]